MASYEFLRAASGDVGIFTYVVASIFAAVIQFITFASRSGIYFKIVLFLLMAIIFVRAMIAYRTEKKIKLSDITAALFAGAIMPYFLASIVGLKMMPVYPKYYVLLPFIVAFLTDAGAYFSGVFLGKHKAVPHISPNKTVEGYVGGLVVSVISMILYGVILQAVNIEVDFIRLAIYGVVGGFVTQIGDLAFSLIKRELSIKDYGSLLPGHGGMMDRFDSMVFAAPVVFVLAVLLPAF